MADICREWIAALSSATLRKERSVTAVDRREE
jgi:hypothetical protein